MYIYKSDIKTIHMKISNIERIKKVVEKVSGKVIPDIELDKELRPQLELDSIQLVELISALEEESKIELPISVMHVKTGKEFLAYFD